MRSILASCFLVFMLSPVARAEVASPGAVCGAAIRTVEQQRTTPPDLLAAIAMVESGRRDPRSGAAVAWPWTIDAAGQPAFFATKAEAIAAVRALQAGGVRSIDVGCMQVNLQQHPAAFATLDDAFDPLKNVRYAAGFLASLFGRAGQWTDAAALYHSATPDLGAAYRRKVMAIWPGGIAVGTKLTMPSRTPLARAWQATLSGDSGTSSFQPASFWHRAASTSRLRKHF